MKIRRKHFLQGIMCFVTGLAAGFALWRSEGISYYMQGFRKRLAHVSVSNDTIGGKIKDLPNDEVDELRELLHKKLKDLKDAGMLEKMEPQRPCTSKENITSKCTETNCSGSLLPNTSPENIRSVRKPVHAVGIDKLTEAIKAFGVEPKGKKYTIITAASSNHFAESQAAIKSLHKTVLPHLTNYSLYYYDLGLKEKERQLVREFSGFELRTFPFDKLPANTRKLQCYTWKPLILLAHLQFSEFVMWMDASLVFLKDLRPYFEKLSKTGILLRKNPWQMPQHTYLGMFSYFGDHVCQFSEYAEVQAGFMVLHNEPFIRRLIIEPWSACALDPKCMCPAESIKLHYCNLSIRKYGKCHRYDQATIGYITIKVLRENRPSIFYKELRHKIQQGQRGSYLLDLQKAKHSTLQG